MVLTTVKTCPAIGENFRIEPAERDVTVFLSLVKLVWPFWGWESNCREFLCDFGISSMKDGASQKEKLQVTQPGLWHQIH